MIQIENLSFGYSRKLPLFQNLNLTLSYGHIYGLLGKNGAGKSTLLKNMVGLNYPQAGRCLFRGVDVANRSPELLADLFFLPEEIYVPSQTVNRFVSNTACFYPKFDVQLFHRLLNEFEVPQTAFLNQLSFGQQKKVMISFSLATNTSFLVMDEPTNGLDIPSKVQFRRIIASILNEDRCIIISTHQVRDLDSLIDTVVVLHNREVILNEALDSIAERLYFTTVADTTGLKVLYEEESYRGKQVILPNDEGRFSKIDLELLFNALISGNQFLTQPPILNYYEKFI